MTVPRPGEFHAAHTILHTVVGSRACGIDVEGSDQDEMVIYVEPSEDVFWPGRNAPKGRMIRTKPEGERSGAEDTDITVYSLRKYFDLLVKGNPSVLQPLFVADGHIIKMTDIGQSLRDGRHKFLTRHAVRRFLGYLDAQRAHLTGAAASGQKRPELVEHCGYDVKFAAHALRLAYQALEIVRDGTITLPIPSFRRGLVLGVRQGKVTRDDMLGLISSIERVVMEKLDDPRCPLPEYVDSREIAEWSARLHFDHWRDARRHSKCWCNTRH